MMKMSVCHRSAEMLVPKVKKLHVIRGRESAGVGWGG